MGRLASGLGFALLLGSGATAMAQTTLVILNPDNGYMDEVEPGVVLTRNPFTGKGPLLGGTVLEFSCGSCDVATFSDAVNQLGGSVKVCGLRPEQIVLMDVQVCMRSTVTGNLYDLDLLTWDSNLFPCVDADGGTSCASTGGYAGYVRSVAAADPLELLTQLIQNVAGLNLHHGIENSLMVKLNGAWQNLTDPNPENDGAAINQLQAFVNQVEAQSGKKITAADAENLVASAQAIIEALQGS
jgi:hypothetical protein